MVCASALSFLDGKIRVIQEPSIIIIIILLLLIIEQFPKPQTEGSVLSCKPCLP